MAVDRALALLPHGITASWLATDVIDDPATWFSTVEIVELPKHPFFLATLFQPQAGSNERELHPLLEAFANALANRQTPEAGDP